MGKPLSNAAAPADAIVAEDAKFDPTKLSVTKASAKSAAVAVAEKSVINGNGHTVTTR